MRRDTASSLVLLYDKIKNIQIKDWFILFQPNKNLSVIFMRFKACHYRAFLKTGHQNLDKGNGVKFSNYFISPLLYKYIIYFYLLLTKIPLALSFVLYFTQI